MPFVPATAHQPHIDLGPIEASDKVLHFLEFFGYSFLLLRLLNVCQVKNSAFWTISISTLYGISDEIHQFFITGRDCSLGDVVVDIFGAVTLVVIYLLLKKVFSLRSV